MMSQRKITENKVTNGREKGRIYLNIGMNMERQAGCTGA